ncbi:hypothetical protein HF086_011196 [Spodoptera exigua]|uniref:PiggyBac transposable element-derived protein domain-containing protein n=1 Tax=Spodoptera exigua TaxID=7107 RepID=A0A922SMM2_SPOEX|nr:hypothetical protein HF086_011196 [Spodoptera exigua]
MKNSVYPERELTIDGSWVLIKGRQAIRQYKRHNFIKLHVLADPKGLVHRINMNKRPANSEVSGTEHAKKVVLKLVEDYLNAGHSLYMDDTYNSVDLAESLLRQNTYCTGTLRSKTRGNPVSVTSKRLTSGSVIYRKNEKGVCVMKWKGSRKVLALSTEHKPDILSKPEIIDKYNKFIKGVDRHEQMLSNYPFEHKTKWYKKVGIHIMQMMFVNSFVMFKEGTGKIISLDKYRDEILRFLLPPAPETVSVSPTHMPKEVDRDSKGVLKRRKCFRCWKLRKIRKDTRILCPDCGVGLCIGCYAPHHDENNF